MEPQPANPERLIEFNGHASRHATIVSNDVKVDASGQVDLSGSNRMNYTGTAKVPARRSGLTNLVGVISGVAFANGKLSFPFALGGTLDNPRFVLKTTKGVLSGFSTGPAMPFRISSIFSAKRRPRSRRQSKQIRGDVVSSGLLHRG